jgi:hypothetical protein
MNTVKDAYTAKTLEAVASLPKNNNDVFSAISKGATYAYYAVELTEGLQQDSMADYVVGFVASRDTKITFDFGILQATHDISAGSFTYAYADNLLPLVSAPYSKFSISKLDGAGYIIYAILENTLHGQLFHFHGETRLGDGRYYIAYHKVQDPRRRAEPGFFARLFGWGA